MRPKQFDEKLQGAEKSLMAFALRLTHDRTKAEDLVQETFARAMTKHASFEMGTNIKAWLFTILRNEFLSTIRRNRLMVGGLSPEDIVRPVNEGQTWAYDLKIILGRMEGLNPTQRACIELIALEQMSYDEVSELLGMPAGTVKSNVSRAREMLVSMGDGYGGGQ